MQAIVLAIATTAVGVAVTLFVSRHYYGRTSKHRLAIYSFPFPEILSNVDPETRSNLTISFHDKSVKSLNVAEFLIANEGSDAIRDPIKPLSAVVDQAQIVDASITYVYPEGREVVVELDGDQKFSCRFPLLNPGEYFYLKLITDGHLGQDDIKFAIAAESLPPFIYVESGAAVNINPNGVKSFDVGAIVVALVVLAIGLSIGLPIVGLYKAHPQYFPFISNHFTFSWWLTVPLVITGVISAIMVIAAFAITITAILGRLSPRPSFRRPGRYGQHFYGYGIPYVPFEESAAARYPRESE